MDTMVGGFFYPSFLLSTALELRPLTGKLWLSFDALLEPLINPILGAAVKSSILLLPATQYFSEINAVFFSGIATLNLLFPEDAFVVCALGFGLRPKFTGRLGMVVI